MRASTKIRLLGWLWMLLFAGAIFALTYAVTPHTSSYEIIIRDAGAVPGESETPC